MHSSKTAEGQRPRDSQSRSPYSVVSSIYSLFVAPLERPRSDTKQEIARKVFSLVAMVSFGYVVAFIYYYWHGIYLGQGYPRNTFLFLPEYRFSDYDDMLLMVKNLNPYHDHSQSSYPPFANLFLFLFTLLPQFWGFIVYLGGPLLSLMCFGWKLLDSQAGAVRIYATAIIFALSYPWLISIDRANVDIWIFVFIGLFLYTFDRREPYLRDLGLVALGAAVAFKLFPVLLVGLLIKNRRFTDCVKVGVLALILTLVAGTLFVGGMRLAFSEWLAVMQKGQSITQADVSFARMNLGLYYAICLTFRQMGVPESVEWVSRFASAFSLIILAIYSMVTMVRPLALWAAATVLIALMCLFPSLSYDYRMIHLSIPILLFLRTERLVGWRSWAILALFALLLVPKNYYVFYPDIQPGDVGIASVLNPLFLLALATLALLPVSPINTNRSRSARS